MLLAKSANNLPTKVDSGSFHDSSGDSGARKLHEERKFGAYFNCIVVLINMALFPTKSLATFVALFVLSLVIAFGPGPCLVHFAYHTGDQSYILLVPLLSAGLIYLDRERIFATAGAKGVTTAGFGCLSAGGALIAGAYFASAASELQMVLVALGLISFWTGAFIVAFGSAAARKATFPFGMLLWMVPIPVFLTDRITYALQWGSAEVTAWLFALTGIPVFRDGFVFQLPGQAIEIAKQCSGIRSSLSLMLLTLIIAHEALRGTGRRLTLLVSTLPIVVLKNGIRIVTLTLLAIYVDPSFLTGSLHHDGGIVFFLIGLVMLYPILKLLQRGERREPRGMAPTGAAAVSGS
jgi:exosortase